MNRNDQTEAPSILAELLRDCLAEIVLHEKDLAVRAYWLSPRIIDVAIKANPGDVKRIIGTGGALFRALGGFCKCWGQANDAWVELERFDVPKAPMDRYREFSPDRFWPRDRIVGLLERMVESIIQPAPACRIIPMDAQRSHLVFDAEAWPAPLPDALQVLANAMGKKNGHTLSVDFRKIVLAQNAIRR